MRDTAGWGKKTRRVNFAKKQAVLDQIRNVFGTGLKGIKREWTARVWRVVTRLLVERLLLYWFDPRVPHANRYRHLQGAS